MAEVQGSISGVLRIPVVGACGDRKIVKAWSIVRDDEFGRMLFGKSWNLSSWGYVRCNKPKIRRIHQGYDYMHRMVCERHHPKTDDATLVDHIDMDVLNNTPENLRWTTKSANGSNCRKRKHSRERFKGVQRNRKSKSWFATITVNKKLIYLGSFASDVEAAKVYNEAFAKYHPGVPLPNPV